MKPAAAICVVALTLAATGPAVRGQQLDLSHGGPVSITASEGMEWRQEQREVIARGNAKAVRQNVTVVADRLIAFYRPKSGAAAQPAQSIVNGADTGGNEIYRVQAEGGVRIFTPTDQAVGDRAVYDMDQAVLVMTGRALKLTTPNEVLTARDSLEYWAQKRMAVARGDAVVVTNDGRRISADTLVAYTTEAPPTPGQPQNAEDPLAASGKLQKVEAFGNVTVRTTTDTAIGDRAVYVPDSGIARLAGRVRITRGDNQLDGSEAEVNMKTGISRLLAGSGGRVQGLVIPNDTTKSAAERKARTGWTKMNDFGPEARPPSELRVVAGGKGLAARGVGKTYRKRPVVRNVTIELRRGEAVGLLGPNGAGKTTTFYMIVGLVKPDTGGIHLDGADITSLPMYRRARLGIGYLPQEASVFRGLNVEQNVMAALEVTERDPDRRDVMLDELLAEFGIGHLRRTPALALSGGERRRVEIARALATQPAYILLDEPLAGIDPIAVNEIRDLVSHLKDRGIGVLITDHNVRETLGIIDRAYIMHDGQMLMQGSPEEVVANRDVRRFYLGERFSL